MADGNFNEALYRKMAKNCLVFYLGIEEISNSVPGSRIKTQLAKEDNLDRLVKAMRDFGMPMLYSMIFGTNLQQPGYGQYAAQRVLQLKMNVSTHILSPRPGLPIWNQVEQRLHTQSSLSRDMGTVLFDTDSMSIHQIEQEYWTFMNAVFAPEQIRNRFADNIRSLGVIKASALLASDFAYLGSTLRFNSDHPDIVRTYKK
jgi:hypothetical protein